MHEMALAESIVGIIEAEAKRQRFTRVKGVWLEIGALAAVEPEALRFAFDVVTRGTVAEQALLEIIATEGRAWCYQCEREVAVTSRIEPCPRCGSHQLHVQGGDQMRIKELEVE